MGPASRSFSVVLDPDFGDKSDRVTPAGLPLWVVFSSEARGEFFGLSPRCKMLRQSDFIGITTLAQVDLLFEAKAH